MPSSIVSQKFEDISTWMTSSQPTDLPDILKGVFFMDGNPLPDDCLTLSNLEWDQAALSLTVPVAAPIQWTFHRSICGWFLLWASQLSRFKYKIQFEDNSLQRAQVIPITLGIPTPRWVINATMCQDTDDNKGNTWQRKNSWFGGLSRAGEYLLRRIVDENNQHTPAFEEMLRKVDAECWVIEPKA